MPVSNPFRSVPVAPKRSRSSYLPRRFGKIAIFGFTSGESMFSVKEWDPEIGKLAEKGRKTESFTGILCEWRWENEWYKKEYDTEGEEIKSKTNMPTCKSPDGIYGSASTVMVWSDPDYTGECGTCGKSDWGGGCKPSAVAYVMDAELGTVYWVRISTTNVAPFEEFVDTVEDLDIDDLRGCLVTITTSDYKNTNGFGARLEWDLDEEDPDYDAVQVEEALALIEPHLKPSDRPVRLLSPSPAVPAVGTPATLVLKAGEAQPIDWGDS